MLAYILQMLFFALSIFSVVIMFVMVLKDMTATKKQWWTLLLPILLLFMVFAYRFDWNENATSDLNRYFRDFAGLRQNGFDYEMQYADEFSWLWRMIAYAFCGVKNLHWFPMFSVAVDFTIFFYILVESAEDNKFSALDMLLCLILRLCLLPIIISVSAPRNTLAYSFFSLGVYAYYKYGYKNVGVYLWMLAGVMTHTTVLLGVVLFFLARLIADWKPMLFVFVLVGALYGSVIGPMLEGSTNEYIQYFVGKWEMYSVIPNKYDVQKTEFIMVGLLPLFIWMLCWYLSKNQSPRKLRTGYILANMATTIGVSTIMPTLFLRLCYPTAITMPILWGESKRTLVSNTRNSGVYWLILVLIVLVLLLSTRLAWSYELYWFFEM